MNYNKTEPIVLSSPKVQNSQAVEDAQAVLISLGYERDEIKNAMSKAVVMLKENAAAEDILKQTLQILSL